jgi:hypothetical protein
MQQGTPTQLELPNGNGIYVFSSWQEVQEWVEGERAAWQRLAAHQPNTWQRYQAVFELRSATPPSGPFPGDDWKERQGRLVDWYKVLIRHDSPKGKLALEIGGESLAAGGGAWAYFTRAPNINHLEQAETHRGIAVAIAHEAGTPLASPVASRTYDALVNEARSWLADVRRAFESEHAASIESRRAAEEFTKRASADIETIRAKAENDFNELKKRTTDDLREVENQAHIDLSTLKTRAEEELAAITQTYNDKLALQSSVTYWAGKRDRHRFWSRCFGWSFIAAVLVFGVGLLFLVPRLIPEDATWDKTPVARLAESVVIITFIVWIIRTLARLFLVNLHLAEDAAERVVMTNTYLALLRESAGVKDNDRRLVLEALFRRASTGIVKDDANPPFFLGLLQRRESDAKT